MPWSKRSEVNVRREDGKTAIWWVRGWRVVGEEPWPEWLDVISNQRAVVVLAEPLDPELIIVAASERRNGHLEHILTSPGPALPDPAIAC
jgi:hypothetical protein